jgi:hypothetical protein
MRLYTWTIRGSCARHYVVFVTLEKDSGCLLKCDSSSASDQPVTCCNTCNSNYSPAMAATVTVCRALSLNRAAHRCTASCTLWRMRNSSIGFRSQAPSLQKRPPDAINAFSTSSMKKGLPAVKSWIACRNSALTGRSSSNMSRSMTSTSAGVSG